MTALAGRKADFYATSGASVAMPTEPMSDIAAAGFTARTTYAVTNAVKRYFDPATAIVFQRSLDSGGTWNPVVPDVVYPGAIQFVAQQQLAPLAQFRVLSGNYLPWARVGGGHEWDFNPIVGLFDVTEFGQVSKHHVSSVISEGTVTLKRWWLDDTMRSQLGARMVIVLYIDATAQPAGPRYEMFGMLKADSLKVAVAAIEEEDLTFDVDSSALFLAA